MANNSVMNLKVFLRDDKDSEARRFTVDTSVVTSYLFMKEKLQTVFPTLRETQFKITWKDHDNDEITIATDDDFITAFTEMSNDHVKTLYVSVVQRNPEGIFMAGIEEPNMMRSPRIVCDACNQVINGYRYKCLQCPDYDLCTTCEFQGNHSDHVMMRVPNHEMYMPKCARKFMHHLARGLKKSAYAANKEAYRAAKYATKFCGNPMAGPSTTDDNKNAQGGESAGSAQENQARAGCPFSSGEEGFNLGDLQGLGEMAKQHLGPIFDIIQNAATQPPQENANNNNSAGNNDQGGLLADAIRNAMQGIFGPIPETTPSANAPSSSTSSKPPSHKSSTAGSTTGSFETPQNAPSEPTTPQNTPSEQTSMDVDESNGKKDEQPARREAGWAFVSNANQSGPNAPPQADPNTIYPALFYHENPKIAEGLVKLHEMGFSNDTGMLTHLLERHHGDVSAVVRTIVDMKI